MTEKQKAKLAETEAALAEQNEIKRAALAVIEAALGAGVANALNDLAESAGWIQVLEDRKFDLEHIDEFLDELSRTEFVLPG